VCAVVGNVHCPAAPFPERVWKDSVAMTTAVAAGQVGAGAKPLNDLWTRPQNKQAALAAVSAGETPLTREI
jgi:hypothetical protein